MRLLAVTRRKDVEAQIPRGGTMPIREMTPRKKGYRKRKPTDRVRKEMEAGPASTRDRKYAPGYTGPTTTEAMQGKGRLSGFKAEERAALKTRMDAAIAQRNAARTAGDRAAFAAAQDAIKAIREERSALIAQKKEAKKAQSARGSQKKADQAAKKRSNREPRTYRERKPKE